MMKRHILSRLSVLSAFVAVLLLLNSGGTVEAAGCTGTEIPIIQEIQTSGDNSGASDEFVEIANPNACDLVISGYRVRYSSSNGSAPSTKYTFNTPFTLYAGETFLIAGANYNGPAQAPTAALSSGIADSGQLAITMPDPDGTVVDAGAWGTINTFQFGLSGAASYTPSTSSDLSISRNPGYVAFDAGSPFAAQAAASPDVCGTGSGCAPTAITLRGLSASSGGTTLPVMGLALAGLLVGTVVVRRK